MIQALAAACLIMMPTQAAEPGWLTIGFVNRPGYCYTDGSGAAPTGLLVDIAEPLLAATRTPHSYLSLPQNRLITLIKAGDTPICALGLFKTPERESFARFSRPIYQNQPIGVLIRRADAAAIGRFTHLAALIQSTDFVLGVIDGFSYGHQLDAVIATMRGRKLAEVVMPTQLIMMLANRRIDYMFADPEEVPALTKTAGIGPTELQLLAFPDIPEGNKRYLMCSKAVPPTVLGQLDMVLAADPAAPPP